GLQSVLCQTLPCLERNVTVLLRRVLVALGLKRLEGPDENRSGITWIDDVVDVSARSRDVRMRELLAVFLDLGIGGCGGIRALQNLLPEQDLDCALGTHYRDFRGWPGDVEVAANVFRAHHVVRTAVRLSRNHGQLGNGRLAIGIKQLRAMLDDSAMLLSDA